MFVFALQHRSVFLTNINAKQYFGFQDGCIRLFLLSIMMVSVILSIRVMMKIKSVYCDYRGWFTCLPYFHDTLFYF